jgi:PHAX RNA-binding domain
MDGIIREIAQPNHQEVQMTEQQLDGSAIDQAVQILAAALGETEADPLAHLRQIIAYKGVAFAERILKRAREIEANGGMRTHDGTRQRTLGGIFFYLTRRRITREEHRVLWPHHDMPTYRNNRGGHDTEVVTTPAIAWTQRGTIYATLTVHGEVHRVNINLVGRPGRIAHQGDYVLTTMRGPKPPTLPRGLPSPPESPPRYAICIARKQWDVVAPALENPNDALVVEGYAAFDEQLPGIIVYAKSVTTKQLQIAQRQQYEQVRAQNRARN